MTNPSQQEARVWTTPKDLKTQLMRRWERGELLRDAVAQTTRFPLRLTLNRPSSADITNRFDAVRAWASKLADTTPLRIEWEEVRHRVQGVQRLPSGVWIDTVEDAIDWLGRHQDWDRFANIIDITRQLRPALLPWLAKRPLQALELSSIWPQLLAVVAWLLAHPRPGIYLRQVDISGIHSKFIEAHRVTLAELLDLALPISSVDASKSGMTKFAARYGFQEKPVRIRFRILDPEIQTIAGISCPDITLDDASFSRLTIEVRQVLITENETNFLAVPPMPNAIAIFGSGYGWDALAQARWLEPCAIYYWGDIDTHGFAILDQLRGHFSHVVSLLMDRTTLYAHQSIWGQENKPHRADLYRLKPEELDLYNDLRDNRIREGLRLEQEHLSFGWVRDRLHQILQ